MYIHQKTFTVTTDNDPRIQHKRAARGGTVATLLELMDQRKSSTSTWEHEGPLMVAVCLILLCAEFIFGVAVVLVVFFFAFVGYTLMAFLGSAIHISFHEREFEFECYAWYRDLRSVHMIHQLHHKNCTMVNIEIDRLFASLMPVSNRTIEEDECASTETTSLKRPQTATPAFFP